MGQYFKFVILADDGTIELAVNPHTYNFGARLTDMAYLDTDLTNAIEWLLSAESDYRKHRCVLAGDYADAEPDTNETLYALAKDHEMAAYAYKSYRRLPYIVNHTKQLYINKAQLPPNSLHPLLLLIVEGNGRGTGDYRGAHRHLVGRWARDAISMEADPPEAGFIDVSSYFRT